MKGSRILLKLLSTVLAMLLLAGSFQALAIPQTPSVGGKEQAAAASGVGTDENAYVVRATKLIVRTGPLLTAAPMGKLSRGDKVTVIARTGHKKCWWKISYNGGVGYVYNTFLTRAHATKFGEYRVNADKVSKCLNVRQGPMTSTKSIAKLKPGTKVKVVKWRDANYADRDTYDAFNGDWIRIEGYWDLATGAYKKLPNGGWIASWYVDKV